jgi:A/G-specific adenine glycosylase
MPSLGNAEKITRMRRELLAWYDRTRRDLPWRRTQDPYAIWVSEIMLQQTRVAVVIEKYKAFLERFPSVKDLALADEQDVLALWSGLGYYRRARMLHKAAMQVVEERGGRMPETAEELQKLAGIGSYTAAAVASIAFNEPNAAVDGNVERVLSRVRGWESHDALSEAAVRRKVEAFAAELVDPYKPGDFNQALMELGATVCTPRSPQCLVCPWAAECRTLGEHKTPKRAPMTSRDVSCALAVREGLKGDEVLLEQRAATNTVMPGMWELPALDNPSRKYEPIMTVRHAIMQVNYTVQVCSAAQEGVAELAIAGATRRWVPVEKAATMALTGLARKVLTRAGMLRASGSKGSKKIARFAAPETAELV